MSEQSLEHEHNIWCSINVGHSHQLPLSLMTLPPRCIASAPPRPRKHGQETPAQLAIGKSVVGLAPGSYDLTLASYPFTISVFSLRQPRMPVLFLGKQRGLGEGASTGLAPGFQGHAHSPLKGDVLGVELRGDDGCGEPAQHLLLGGLGSSQQ